VIFGVHTAIDALRFTQHILLKIETSQQDG